jgi:hypothetical protein
MGRVLFVRRISLQSLRFDDGDLSFHQFIRSAGRLRMTCVARRDYSGAPRRAGESIFCLTLSGSNSIYESHCGFSKSQIRSGESNDEERNQEESRGKESRSEEKEVVIHPRPEQA